MTCRAGNRKISAKAVSKSSDSRMDLIRCLSALTVSYPSSQKMQYAGQFLMASSTAGSG